MVAWGGCGRRRRAARPRSRPPCGRGAAGAWGVERASGSSRRDGDRQALGTASGEMDDDPATEHPAQPPLGRDLDAGRQAVLDQPRERLADVLLGPAPHPFGLLFPAKKTHTCADPSDVYRAERFANPAPRSDERPVGSGCVNSFKSLRVTVYL